MKDDNFKVYSESGDSDAKTTWTRFQLGRLFKEPKHLFKLVNRSYKDLDESTEKDSLIINYNCTLMPIE